ncbi:MAG: ATPase, T2SS/T4P/T4SS family, partial [Bdellovibrionota bacterium]
MAREKTRIGMLSKVIFHKLLTEPAFAIAVATTLAKRLQQSNRSSGVKYYSGPKPTRLLEYAKLLPHSIMDQHKILVLDQQETKLLVGMVNPQNDLTLPILKRYLSKYRIEITGIRDRDFDVWIREVTHSTSTAPTNQVTPRGASPPKTLNVVQGDPGQVLNTILQHALQTRASDIHLEPSDDSLVVRFRIDGHLHEQFGKIPLDIGRQIQNRIKIASGLNIAENRLPQDGQLKISLPDGRPLSGRVSTIPSLYGETFVIRLYKAGQAVIPLDRLAPDKHIITLLREILYKQEGVLLVVGPTGSGKTSTLYSMISALNTVDSNVITVEDPIEIRLAGVTQVQVNEPIDLGYGKILRHLLRQDPDVIMIGEIRDSASAQIAFEAAQTGHIVFTTIHANNSLDVLHRLQEIRGT